MEKDIGQAGKLLGAELKDPIRIRVVFVNCPRLQVDACTYLLASQNKIQSVFEFEIYNFHRYSCNADTPTPSGLFSHLCKKIVCYRWGIPLERFGIGRLRAYLDRHVEPLFARELPRSVTQNGLRLQEVVNRLFCFLKVPATRSSPREATVIVTETALEEAYYIVSNQEQGIAVVSMDGWQNFTPPSVLEFLLNSVQCCALSQAYLGWDGFHEPTRGCMGDADMHIQDTRSAIALGYLCSECRGRVEWQLSPGQMDVIDRWISMHWLGSVEESGSVARNLKNIYGYDLSRTKGFSPRWHDKIKDIIVERGVDYIIKITFLLLMWKLLLGGISADKIIKIL